jgi:hypothetical protein
VAGSVDVGRLTRWATRDTPHAFESSLKNYTFGSIFRHDDGVQAYFLKQTSLES